ncbi:MAG: hypothetical protein WCO86_18705 [Planctomycetota bacterium]
MNKMILLACLGFIAPSAALAGNIVINDPTGTVSKNVSHTRITNNSTITGGNQTGLTVTGSNNTVVNKGTITGSTGVSTTGSGSSTVVNSGTIRATSSSTSSASAVGVSISVSQ